ncbi:MAG: hypothetical protein MK214_08250 [Thalassotalea sp.]|nr:hypothetical protein [Thalassotalea sp.]
MVQHSKPTKILAYVCALILLPAFFAVPILIANFAFTSEIHNSDITDTLFLGAVATLVLYHCIKYCYLLLRFLKTLSHKLDFDDKGITLWQKNSTEFYPWETLFLSKAYDSCQMYSVVDSNKRHLISIWEYADRYNEFRAMAIQKIGH